MDWDDMSLRVPSDKAFVARYRRLQSWYRETCLGIEDAGVSVRGRVVGSMLPEAAVVRQPGLNFLTPAAFDHAHQRMREVQGEGGTLEVDRLRRNMLSSMPLCFNIFGALRQEAGLLELVQAVFDPLATRVVEVVCEWAPRPAEQYLSDRTAFDAIVAYEDRSGSLCVLGVETKYTEPLSARLPRSDENYERVCADCGWFREGASTTLWPAATNQLYRSVLLAASMVGSDVRGVGHVDRAMVAVVGLDGDLRGHLAVDGVRGQLVDDSSLLHVSLEKLVAIGSSSACSAVQTWAELFEHRYLYPTDALTDADGEPIHEGDTVIELIDGDPFMWSAGPGGKKPVATTWQYET